jgi:hypothetical protein
MARHDHTGLRAVVENQVRRGDVETERSEVVASQRVAPTRRLVKEWPE